MNCWEMAILILYIHSKFGQDDIVRGYPAPSHADAIEFLGLEPWTEDRPPPLVDGAVIGWIHPAVGLAHVVICVDGQCVSFLGSQGQHPRFVPFEQFVVPSIPVDLPVSLKPFNPAELAAEIPAWRKLMHLAADIEKFERAVDSWADLWAAGAGPSMDDINTVAHRFMNEDERVIGAQSTQHYSSKYTG
jgi:hypothetical protein